MFFNYNSLKILQKKEKNIINNLFHFFFILFAKILLKFQK